MGEGQGFGWKWLTVLWCVCFGLLCAAQQQSGLSPRLAPPLQPSTPASHQATSQPATQPNSTHPLPHPPTQPLHHHPLTRVIKGKGAQQHDQQQDAAGPHIHAAPVVPYLAVLAVDQLGAHVHGGAAEGGGDREGACVVWGVWCGVACGVWGGAALLHLLHVLCGGEAMPQHPCRRLQHANPTARRSTPRKAASRQA